jgi:fatty acid desaturase
MLESTRARRRAVAWPTLFLATFSFLAWGAQFWLGVQGYWPAWAVVVGNMLCAYTIYITVHDAAHGAFAKARWANEWLGRVWILALTPFIAFSAYRYLHLQHHRATNEPQADPDMWASGERWWTLAFKFATIDLAYWAFYLRRLPTRPRKEVVEAVLSLGVSIGMVAALWAFGLGREVLLFWILPGRLAIFFLAWLFDYMPHRPHGVAQKENAYQATNIRVGAERWLSPLLLWQNYHLVHHLYPREPFYLTVDLWREKERWHLDQSPLLVDVWGRPLSAQAYLAVRAREGTERVAAVDTGKLGKPRDLEAR